MGLDDRISDNDAEQTSIDKSKIRLKQGALLARTAMNLNYIELLCDNGSIKIPLNRTEETILTLETECKDKDQVYSYGPGPNPLLFKGDRVEKIIEHINKAKDIGCMVGLYYQLF